MEMIRVEESHREEGDNKKKWWESDKGLLRSAIRIPMTAGRDEYATRITLHSNPRVTAGDPLALI